MIHEELEILISRWDDPDLTKAERSRLDKALAENSEAQELLKQFQRLDEQLAQMPDGLDEVDFVGFRERLGSAIATSQRPGRASRLLSLRQWWWAPLAAAAALLMVALPWKILSPEKVEPPEGYQSSKMVTLAKPAVSSDNYMQFVQLSRSQVIEAQPEEADGEVICLAGVSGGADKSVEKVRPSGLLIMLSNGSS